MKKDLLYLDIAERYAQESYANKRKVGCVIVKDNRIISDGYNGTISGADNQCEDENGKTFWHVLHAESNAISKLAKSTLSADGATLYTTLSPCRECAKLIIQSGIKRVVYRDAYKCLDGLELMAKSVVVVDRL